MESLKTLSDKEIHFDINTLQTINREGYNGDVLFLTENETNFSDSVGYQLGIFSLEDDSIKAIIVRNELISDTELTITYLDLNLNIIEQIKIDNDLKTVSFSYNMKPIMLDCGNEIMGCIRTMYWELGWGSVSWWVGQAIFGAPWALGTIAGCGVAVCIL